MRRLRRILLALQIVILEARIEYRRFVMAREAAKIDRDRRAVNAAHQAFAALDARRHQPSIHQLRPR